jgi:type I restriction enzyme M protein
LALFLRLLKPEGRAAVIVPDGVFKPYAGVSTAILLFTKTNSGGTDWVWFYEVEADGWSLDDKRQPLLPQEKLGAVPQEGLTQEKHAKNNLPDVLARWLRLRSATVEGREEEKERPRTAQSFCVPKADIVANGYDLSLNRYKEAVHEVVEHVPPQEILATLAELETKIQQGMKELEEMLG